MRLTRVAQASIFENYSEHELGQQLESLSQLLDEHPEILSIPKEDLTSVDVKATGREGLSIETIFRCAVLKQHLRVSYEQLAFDLSDSVTYRTFVRLSDGVSPSRSALQSVVRAIKPSTLVKIQDALTGRWVSEGLLDCEKLRVDSTVTQSNIAPPSDSQLLCDSIRVLSRLLAKSQQSTGIKIRF